MNVITKCGINKGKIMKKKRNKIKEIGDWLYWLYIDLTIMFFPEEND
jgi:hypothetical protein